MSIIERALGKLQQVAGGQQTAPTQQRSARPSSRRANGEGEGRSSSPAREVRTYAQTITLNAEELRSGGALPPEEHANNLTDQFRRIKWPILEAALAKPAAGGHPPNRVMVTSSIAGEGKTFTSFNLAQSIAREKDVSVLLVDADVAKRHLSELLKVGESAGLMDAIGDSTLDVESLVMGTSIPGLAVLPAGRRSSSAPELFASHRMVELVEQLGRHDPQRIVLFDSSPLLATNESQVLGKLVDQVVMVVRAEFTTQPMVLEAIGFLDKGRQIRCVLNQARMSRTTEYYYGYYPNDRTQQ